VKAYFKIFGNPGSIVDSSGTLILRVCYTPDSCLGDTGGGVGINNIKEIGLNLGQN